MDVRLIQEILFIAAGVVLVIVAAAITYLVISQLIIGRGQSITRKKRRGREDPPA